MAEPKLDGYQQLDKVIDDMLSSDAFRKQAAESGSIALRVAALLIDAPHPQLSPESKQLIQQHVLDSIQEPVASNTVANFSQSEATLSDAMKSRMFAPVSTAQQLLQLDALVYSDEALVYAKTNPDPIIQAAVRLADAPLPVLSAEAKRRIHQQIVSAPSVEPKRVLVPNFGASIQRVAASIAILLFMSLLLAPSVSANSLPGDLLYPVKRTVEKVALQFATNDDARAHQHLQNAQERFSELSILLETNQFNAAILDDAILSLEHAVVLKPILQDDVVFQSEMSNALAQFELILKDYTPQLSDDIAQDFSQRQMVLSEVIIVGVPIDDEPVIEATPEIIILDLSIEEAPSTQEPDIIASSEPDEITPTIEAPEDASAAHVVAVESATVYVNATTVVRVRNAPNLTADIIAQLSPADSVTRLGISNNGQWLHVELADGQRGWVAEFLLVDYPTETSSTGSSNAVTNETANEANNSNGTANGNVNGTANASNNSSVNGNANGLANGNANGNPNANENANGNVNGRGND